MNYEQAYDELLARHKRLSESNDELGKQALKLRAEIRSLHRKLRDANRGAERNAWVAHDLAKNSLTTNSSIQKL
jgi:uncharacterized protein YlxW (UPF0749 family)